MRKRRRLCWSLLAALIASLIFAFISPLIFRPSPEAYSYWSAIRAPEGLMQLIEGYCHYFEWNRTHRPGITKLERAQILGTEKCFTLPFSPAAGYPFNSHFIAAEAKAFKLSTGDTAYIHALWGGSFVDAKQAPSLQGPASWGQIVKTVLPPSAWIALGSIPPSTTQTKEPAMFRLVPTPTWKTSHLLMESGSHRHNPPTDVIAAMRSISEHLANQIRRDGAFPSELPGSIPFTACAENWILAYFPIVSASHDVSKIRSAMLVCGPDVHMKFPPQAYSGPQRYAYIILRSETGMAEVSSAEAREIEWQDLIEASKALFQ
jgi:hypothetical protein